MQTIKILRFVGTIGLLAGLPALADTAALRGPVMGYVLDGRSQAVRPINGIPGAAHLGAPLLLPFPVAGALFSSAGDFALVTPADGEGLYLVSNLGGSASAGRIAGAIRPDRMALNAANTAAVLYQSELRQIQILTGLGSNPAAGRVVDLAGLSGTVAALALDGSGREVLLALRDGPRAALVRIPVLDEGSPEPRQIGVFAAPAAVTLLNRDRDALLSDAGTNQVFLIRDFAGQAVVETLASERDGVLDPVGVEASADGLRVFVASAAGSGSVLVLDLATRTVALRATPEGAPTRLERLQGRLAFVLNEPGEAPLLVLDGVENPEVYFVPAGRDN
jgi:DNA-binding beta-propeller fold protein YncE